MAYRTATCPHCGQVVSLTGSHPKNYGSPFQVCPNCGKTYVDKSFIEMAFQSESQYTVKKVTVSSIAFVIAASVLLLISLIPLIVRLEDTDPMSYVFFCVSLILWISGVVSCLQDRKSYAARCKAQAEELEQSRVRVSNLNYLKALQTIGYSLPSSYLELLNEHNLSH